MSRTRFAPQRFEHGYALLIGVGECDYAKLSLPVASKDVEAIRALLVDPQLCAYPDDEDHIRLLHEDGAKRGDILSGLVWLRTRATADPDATVVVYFCGHGWVDDPSGQYYLIPQDVDPFDFTGSALPATIFAQALGNVPAQRLLVFLDCCHAEGMATSRVESTLSVPSGYTESAPPRSEIEALKRGLGRAVFTSCRGDQRSWIRPGEERTIYTYHLAEALQGAGNVEGDTVVRVSNLMNYLGQAVPESARRLCQAEQTPFFDTATEDFPVALLRAGQGLPKGGWEAIKTQAAEVIQHVYHAEVHGSGAIAQGPGAVSAGERGMALSGSVEGAIIITGDRNVVYTHTDNAQTGREAGDESRSAESSSGTSAAFGTSVGMTKVSLQRQLADSRENLRLIEERKAQYVLETDIPLQLIREERRLRERIADLEHRLGLP